MTILDDIRHSRLSSYSHVPQDIEAHFREEGQIQSDYHRRFVYELIQNADDALESPDSTQRRKLRFELHNNVLLVANNGRPITGSDIRALSTMSYTTKSADGDRRASIGHKGKGFSSVLEITDNPQVYSTGHSFEFNRDKSRVEIEALLDSLDNPISVSGTPVMRLPFEPPTTPREVQKLLDEGFQTVFRFPLTSSDASNLRAEVSKTLARLNANTVVFLRNLDDLEICFDDQNLHWSVTRDEREILDSSELQIVTVTTQNKIDNYALFTRRDIPIGDQTGGTSENTWGEVKLTEVAVATRLKEVDGQWVLTPFTRRPFVHVFLPTQERCPLPILINGAFHSTISRTRIEVSDDAKNYNGFLLSQVANLLAGDVRKFAAKSASWPEFIACLDWGQRTEEDDKFTLATRLTEEVRQAFQMVQFIPVAGQANPAGLDDIILPYSSSSQHELANKLATIIGHHGVTLPGHRDQHLVASELITESHLRVLSALGAEPMSAVQIPTVLAALPEDQRRVESAQADDKLCTDPIIEVLLSTWKTVSADDDLAREFRKACQREALFPVGSLSEDGNVQRVTKNNTVFFFPPETDLPDIELSGTRFLSRALYRPEKPVANQDQALLVAELRPALEAIWDLREFQFEEVLRAAVRPKLTGEDSEHATELQNIEVLRLLARLADRSIGETPLPFIERKKRRVLFSLASLPLPTRDDQWLPAYTLYFDATWSDDEASPQRQVEPLADLANLDLHYVAPPDKFTDDPEEINLFRRFFRWLGVSPHLRLDTLFSPAADSRVASTKGLAIPQDTNLAALPEDASSRYIEHLREHLDKNRPEKHSFLYRIHTLDQAPELMHAASRDIEVGRMLLEHLDAWWEDFYSRFRRPTLGTTTVGYLSRRTSWTFRPREIRRVGIDLWLWQLRETRWCPTSLGNERPIYAWVDQPLLYRRFSIKTKSERSTLLPVVVSQISRGFEQALGLRHEVTSQTFTTRDAAIVCRSIQRVFGHISSDIIAKNLSDIRPKYRSISEILPKFSESSTDSIPVLCRSESGSYDFVSSHDALFIRSPDVREQIPISGLPIFVLESNEAINFAAHFGLHDLEACVTAKSEVDNERPIESESVRERLWTLAPYLLCRLEADRRTPKLKEDDVTNLQNFIKRITLVEGLQVNYSLSKAAADLPLQLGEAPPRGYFLDPERSHQRGRIPLIEYGDSQVGSQDENIAGALCEFLDVHQFEGVITLLTAAGPDERQRLLRLAGAPWEDDELESKRRQLDNKTSPEQPRPDILLRPQMAHLTSPTQPESTQDKKTHQPNPRRYALIDPSELSFGDEQWPAARPISDDSSTTPKPGAVKPAARPSHLNTIGPPQEYTHEVDRAGTALAMRYERRRLEETYGCENASTYIFEVHNPARIEDAKKDPIAGPALKELEAEELSLVYPGFDLLTIHPETLTIDRLIELKSSGLSIQKVGVTWNEWKTARHINLRERFYLYVVGGLRRETRARPFLREIRNPFEVLRRRELTERSQTQRQVQLDLRYFSADEGEVRETEMTVIRNGSEENPAVDLIQDDGRQVLKLVSELEED